MPKVSRNIPLPEVRRNMTEALVVSFARTNNETLIRTFLRDLFTTSEETMIAKRLMTAILLQKGYNYLTICRMLKLSKTTVNSVRRDLAKGGEGYKQIYRRLFREKPWADRFSRWLDALRLPAKDSLSNMKRWEKAPEEL